MAYKFNPFTGNLDEVGTGGGGGTTPPAGSDTQIQFNDGGAFGGDAGLTYNKTTNELTVAGDINLDDGGTFSTTLQSVTPTADRTISFPDATGTVALVSGADGTIQYNDAGTLKGNSNFTVNVDWDNPSTTFTALKVNVPDVLQGFSDSNLLDLQAGGTSRFSVPSTGNQLFSAGGHNFISDANAIVLTNSGGTRAFVSRTDYSILPSAASLRWGNLSSFASDTGLARDSAGVVKITDGSIGTGYLKLIPTIVGALTPAATVGAGTKAFVTDSTSTLSSHHGQAVVGGGNNFVPVFSDGTNWIVG